MDGGPVSEAVNPESAGAFDLRGAKHPRDNEMPEARPTITKLAKSVDDYISAAPKEVQASLKTVREAIREAAPGAKEGISYRIPYYGYKGRLAWFGLHSKHIGLYLRPPVVDEHLDELSGYTTTKSSVHLQLDKKIPVPLVKRLVKAAVRKNDERTRRAPQGSP
jgi:uncharacterized protein YdhG (YjbR/CyaY superfamily)